MAKSTKPAAKKPTTAALAAPGGTGRRAASEGSKIAKTQLTEMVADRTSLNRKQAGDAVAVMLDSIVGALREGKTVGLPGLGTLSVAQTAARQGVRPGTSEKIQIPAGKKVRFKAASTLKGHL